MPEGISPVDPAVFAAGATLAISLALVTAARRPGWVVRWPRSVLLVLFVVTLAVLSVLVRLQPLGVRLSIDPSTESLLPIGDPGHRAYQKAVVDFGDDQIYVIAMETDGIFRAGNLAALRRISDAISRIDGVRGVKSLARITSFRYVPEEDWIEVRPFVEEVPEDPAALESLRDRALRDPVYRRNLISADGRTAALNVTFRDMTDREFIAADIEGQISALLDAESHDARRFYVSGRPHIKARMYDTMTRDLAVLIPTVLIVVALVLTAITGTVRGVVIPMGTVTLAVIWTFGSIALLEMPLTVLTVLLAPGLIAIGSVYGVHVVNRYQEDAASGADRRVVVESCLRAMTVPVLIAGLTTMVGYGALLVTNVPAVFEIGAFSVLGVASITLISLTGVPAALCLLPLRRDALSGGAARSVFADRTEAALNAGLAAVANFTIRRSGGILSVWAIIALAAAVSIPHIDIDTDYLTFFDPDTDVRRDFEAINRLLSGAVPLFVVLEGDGPGYLRDPEVLRRIERLQQRIAALPGVSRTLSFLDTLRVLNRAIESDDPRAERIPDTRGEVTELLFMFPKPELARFATVDHSAANIIVRTGEVGSAALRRLTRRIEETIASSGLPDGLTAVVTGNAILLNRAADGVARSQPLTVGLAAGTIFVLLAIGLRSVGLGLVAMIPNVVPVMIFFGVLGAGAAPLSLPTSLIGSVALGIAIDATAHYLVRYRAERQNGCDPEEAVRRCGVRVGRPIAIGTATLALGFLSVAFSEFATLRQFGFLSSFTMGVCLLTDLVLLPAILVRWRF